MKKLAAFTLSSLLAIPLAGCYPSQIAPARREQTISQADRRFIHSTSDWLASQYLAYGAKPGDIDILSRNNILPERAGAFAKLGFPAYDVIRFRASPEQAEPFVRTEQKSLHIREAIDFLIDSRVPAGYASQFAEHFNYLIIPQFFRKGAVISDLDTRLTREIYHDKIEYLDLSKLTFPEPEERIKIPRDLFLHIYTDAFGPRIENRKEFESLILQEAGKIDSALSQERISKLSPREALCLSIAIVSRRLSYIDIDNKTDEIAGIFREFYGANPPADKVFLYGLIDCKGYTACETAVWEYFRRLNPRLRNIYVTSVIGRNSALKHTWNSLLVFNKNKLVHSQFDVTYFDNGSRLEVQDRLHFRRETATQDFLSSLEPYHKLCN